MKFIFFSHSATRGVSVQQRVSTSSPPTWKRSLGNSVAASLSSFSTTSNVCSLEGSSGERHSALGHSEGSVGHFILSHAPPTHHEAA